MQYLPSAMWYVVCALQYQVTIVTQWYMQYLLSGLRSQGRLIYVDCNANRDLLLSLAIPIQTKQQLKQQQLYLQQ